MGFSRMSGEATNTGKPNSSRVTNGTFPLPHEWLSRRDEIKIPHEWQSREWGIFILEKCSDIAKKQGVIFPQKQGNNFPHSREMFRYSKKKQGNNFPVFLKTGNDFMLYHSPIVDLGSGISLMAILLVSVPLQCGNDFCSFLRKSHL